MTEIFGIIIGVAVLAIVIVALLGTAKIVPQRSAFVVERLGKYSRTLDAGFHILIPFIDRVAYKHSLKEVIKQSEAQKILQINEAEGKAQEIELIANATADGIRRVAAAIIEEGGSAAVNLRIAEQYVREFGNLARTNNTLILPANVSDIGGTVAALATVLNATK